MAPGKGGEGEGGRRKVREGGGVTQSVAQWGSPCGMVRDVLCPLL